MALSIPNTFSADTKIESAPMNANFAEMANAVDKRGDTVTGNISANAGITFDGVDLSTIPVDGSGAYQAPLFDYIATTTNYTLTFSASTPNKVVVNTGSSAITVYLWEATTANKGAIVHVKKFGTGDITITPHGAQTIDGAASAAVTTQYKALMLVSTGTNWVVL